MPIVNFNVKDPNDPEKILYIRRFDLKDEIMKDYFVFENKSLLYHFLMNEMQKGNAIELESENV